MTPFMMLILTVIAIAVIRTFIQVFKFFKFCADVNKLPGPARYPLPTIAFQVRKLNQEGRNIFLNPNSNLIFDFFSKQIRTNFFKEISTDTE